MPDGEYMKVQKFLKLSPETIPDFFFFKKRKKMRFTPYKAEQPLQGMELQEKGAKKD